MEPLGGLIFWKRGRRKDKRDDVRLSQEVLRSTLDQLHTELDELRKEYKDTVDELRAETLELSIALAECDRERIRLVIQMKGLEHGTDIATGDD